MKYLAQVTGPTAEPLSVEEAMAFLRVDDGDESAMVEALISTAREVVENFTGRALLTQTWKLTLSTWPQSDWQCSSRNTSYPGSTIALERTPLVSVESVKYYPSDGTALATLSASTYHVLTGAQPGLVVLKSDQTWPDIFDRPDAVEVNFTAGASTIEAMPKVLRQCVLLTLAHIYENRIPINIGNIVNELPFSLKYLLESQRVGGWVA